MPDLQTELTNKVIRNNLPPVTYIVRYILQHPGALAKDILANKPDNIGTSTLYSLLTQLTQMGVLRRESAVLPTKWKGTPPTVYSYYFQAQSSTGRWASDISAAIRLFGKPIERTVPAKPVSTVSTVSAVSDTAIKPVAADDATHTTPGVRIQVTTSKRRFVFDVAEAREVFNHLSTMFGFGDGSH